MKDNVYFKNALRYIHLNPVRAGLSTHPIGWEFSDYREVIGKRKYIQGDHQFVRSVFGSAQSYENFVTSDMQSQVFESQDFLKDLARTGLL